MLRMLVLLSLFFTYQAISKTEVCSNIVIGDGTEISFTQTEKKLICGDKETAAYQDIPFYQAQYFIKGFLQSRSYLNPQFKVENKVLHIYPGEVTYLKDVEAFQEDGTREKKLEKEVERRLGGYELNPSLLNRIESETETYLRHIGYPCPKIESEVDVKSGLVKITLKDLNRQEFGEVTKQEIPGLHSNALDRYYPFKADERFDGNLLDLTEKRLIRSETVQGSYFLESCEDHGKSFALSQYYLLGPPRTLRFGAGASTEVGPMARVRWANHRLGNMASFLGANLQASFRSQSLVITSDSYLWDNHPRFSLFSELEIRRESQQEYEELTYKVKSLGKWTTEHLNRYWEYTLGPALEAGRYHSEVLSSTRSYATGALVGGVKWISHTYELFDIHPEEGDTFQFDFNYRNRSLGFSEELLRLDSSYAKLFKLSNSGRGDFIFGLRFNAGTSWTNDNVDLKDLPPSMKFYGGGSDDIRGFYLQTLPKNDGAGALTKLGTKLEFRRTRFLFESVESFLFFDGAYFGDRSWNTSPRFWHSPGIGLRWLSPIGLVQTFAARSLATAPSEDMRNLFYLGLGGTF